MRPKLTDNELLSEILQKLAALDIPEQSIGANVINGDASIVGDLENVLQRDAVVSALESISALRSIQFELNIAEVTWLSELYGIWQRQTGEFNFTSLIEFDIFELGNSAELSLGAVN